MPLSRPSSPRSPDTTRRTLVTGAIALLPALLHAAPAKKKTVPKKNTGKARKAAPAAAAASAAVSSAPSAPVGQPAPDFATPDLDGNLHTLAGYRGRVLVLEWFNPSCAFVRKHYASGSIPSLQQECAARGVAWLSVDSTAENHAEHLLPQLLAAWQKSQGAAPTATLADTDGTLARSYGAHVTPHVFIVDAQGTLAYEGAIDSIASSQQADVGRATNHVRQALEDVLAGRAVAQATTRPYGCPVRNK
ncbi:redoxin domain-containing protein [Xylophilus sp.]|uniref:redoxin domain-containing protein n=1 Tax=Xylophilus sp. TaxID=2653893 RepID=UPI0013BDE36B|nr:redoxin domain-containing protein [Xylophilus sp.]KAF1047539.1 MAG: hypothetical protein GAK38_01890 [Xylophilus sp.]